MLAFLSWVGGHGGGSVHINLHTKTERFRQDSSIRGHVTVRQFWTRPQQDRDELEQDLVDEDPEEAKRAGEAAVGPLHEEAEVMKWPF